MNCGVLLLFLNATPYFIGMSRKTGGIDYAS
jgi:hypothetical protein